MTPSNEASVEGPRPDGFYCLQRENVVGVACCTACVPMSILKPITSLRDRQAREAAEQVSELGRAVNDEALIERIAGAEHFAAFDNDGAGSFVCECGLPWIAGEGCAFLQGARAFAVAVISERASRYDTHYR